MIAEADDPEDGIGIVKMTLGGFCKDKTASQVKAAVTGLVKLGNVTMAEAYLFANFHISRCLENPAFPVSRLPLLDRSFYYRCLLAVTVTNLKDGTLGPEIEASQAAYDLLRPEGYIKADMTPFNQLLTELSIQMATMACNSVWANVERYICRYVKAAHPELRRQGKKIANAVVKAPKVPLDKLFPAASTSTRNAGARQVAEKLRGWLVLPTASQFNSRAHLCMRLFHKILGELNLLKRNAELSEQTHANVKNALASSRNAKIRLYNLLPRKNGFTVSYIPITNRTLRVLLRSGSAPLDPSLTGQGDKEDHLPIWRRYFNINAVETRTSRFDERFMTDGKGVSIQRRRMCSCVLDADQSKSALPCDCCAAECRVAQACPEAKVLEVGVDPGMTDIVTAANSDGVVKSFSSSRFSMEAGYHTSARRVKRWNDETEALVASIPSSKVASMVELEAHIRVYLSVLPALLASRFTRGYRSMRFFRYNGKQKAIQKVCDLIAPSDRTVVVGFGDWTNNGSGISRPCSGPIREIRHCLKSRPNVLYKNVDEFRTSCTCHGCHSRLSNMRADSVRLRRSKEGETIRKEVKNSKVHKVLHCCNSVGVEPVMARCGATWNRDVNASKNILMLLKLWITGVERPSVFTRTSKNTVSVRGESFTAATSALTREVGADKKGALSYRPDEKSSEIQA
jgi:hypothetical protein